MRHKGFPSGVIDEVISWLHQQKYLNDKLFAQRYCESVLLGKSVGPRWLKQKLTQKRIAPLLIDQAITRVYEQNPESDLARRAAQAWRRTHQPKSDQTQDKQKYQQRLNRYLVSRGFNYDVISNAI